MGTRASSSTQYVYSPSVQAFTSTGCQPDAHAWRTSANDSQRRCCANARRASSSSAHSATRSAWITSSAVGRLRRWQIASEGSHECRRKRNLRSKSPQPTSASRLMSRQDSTRCAPSRRRAPEQRVLWKGQQVAQRSAGEDIATGGVEHREAIQRFRQQRRKGLRGEHGRGLRLHDLGRHTSWPRGLRPRRSQPFRRAAARWARARRLPVGVEHRRHSARTERGVQRPREQKDLPGQHLASLFPARIRDRRYGDAAQREHAHARDGACPA